jgi:hypothetical protein
MRLLWTMNAEEVDFEREMRCALAQVRTREVDPYPALLHEINLTQQPS